MFTAIGDISCNEDVTWFGSFAAGSRWRFAKTYVESYPHEYMLDEWCDEDDFRRAILSIERWGVLESFWTPNASTCLWTSVCTGTWETHPRRTWRISPV
jgi:hypothetical protein